MGAKFLPLLFAIGAAALSAQQMPAVSRTFDMDPAGARPPGFTFAETRDAGPRRWTVEKDPAATMGHHLVHTNDGMAGVGMAMAILEGVHLREVEVTARMRLVDGDRISGVVWRYQDPSNYYFARLNLSGPQSVSLYRVVNGNRVRLEDEDDLQLDPAAWHTLRVVQGETRARVYLGGIRVFEVRDRTLDSSGGGAGVFCSGNTTAWFDDLHVEPRLPQADSRTDNRHD
jgi:hypothetical protein